MKKETDHDFYARDFAQIDFRQHPELYRVGKGEQGVLLVEPYKSELLPHWRFRTVEIAQHSAETLYQHFLQYKDQGDFVGMDMARKFLQMGYTRARRYANHRSGRKYVTNPQTQETLEAQQQARTQQLPQEPDWQSNEKAQAARLFYAYYERAKGDALYQRLLHEHKEKYERPDRSSS